MVMRCFVSWVVVAGVGWGAPALADDPEGAGRPSGYPTSEPSVQYDVSHDGYGGVGHGVETAEPPAYPVVETESGTTTEYEGESIIVVKEPEPVAASSEPPPPPRVVPNDDAVLDCPSGVWVDGYWDYRNGQYVWVDGHCVEVRVNYVFVAPRWDFYGNVWWFIPGYYRPCGVFVTYGYFRPWHWFPPYPYPYYRTGRPISEFRGVPVRGTVARPVPSSRVPGAKRPARRPTTVIDAPPSGAKRPASFGRSGTGSVVTDSEVRSRHGVGIVTEPGYTPPASRFGASTSGRSRGFSIKRQQSRPSPSGSRWTPSSGSSSGSSRGWGGGRSRSSPSRGSSSGGSSSGRPSGGFGGKHR